MVDEINVANWVRTLRPEYRGAVRTGRWLNWVAGGSVQVACTYTSADDVHPNRFMVAFGDVLAGGITYRYWNRYQAKEAAEAICEHLDSVQVTA